MGKDRDGTVAVKNGKVIISDPEGLGRYPRIIPGENIEIYVDGELITEETVVSEDREIKLKKIEKETKKTLNIEVEEEGLKAYLKITISPGEKIRIPEIAPENKIVIGGVVKEKEYPRVTEGELKGLLREEGICYGIKKKGIKKILDSRDDMRVLIACGEPGREGKDARVVMIDKKQKEDPDEDYNFIESVTAGEVVAYKEPPQPGEKGKDVFGNVIEPPAVKDVELVAGDDVKISPDGMRAIAAAPGTPSLSCHKNKACISIVPTYIVKGDIGKETGNIMYKGNLVVRGNIDDNFDLKIGNNIKVGKSIANTQIVAGGDIYIKRNIISSEINAGGYFDRDLLATIDEMVREINKLLKAIEEIFGAAKKYGNRDELKMGKVLRLLLNDKFRTLMSHLKELSHDLEEVNIPAIMKKECHQLLNKIVGYKKILQIKDTDVFCQLKELLSDILKEGQKKCHSSNVYADYVQNSVIKAAGNVLIKVKGCYNSQIMAGGDIAISGKKGYLRGGNYRAEGSIYVRNVGGGFSTTEVYVEERFYAAEVKGNLIIRTLNDVVKISGSKNNVNLRVNNEGRLKSATGKPDFQKLKNRMTG